MTFGLENTGDCIESYTEAEKAGPFRSRIPEIEAALNDTAFYSVCVCPVSCFPRVGKRAAIVKIALSVVSVIA